MPDRRFHLAAAASVGAGYAAFKSQNQSGLSCLIESTGGAIGSAFGGVLPDVIDPPIHSRQVPVSRGAVLWASLDSFQVALRRQAECHPLDAACSGNWISAAAHSLAELLLRLLAGFLAGFGAGYLSHVILGFRNAAAHSARRVKDRHGD